MSKLPPDAPHPYAHAKRHRRAFWPPSENFASAGGNGKPIKPTLRQRFFRWCRKTLIRRRRGKEYGAAFPLDGGTYKEMISLLNKILIPDARHELLVGTRYEIRVAHDRQSICWYTNDEIRKRRKNEGPWIQSLEGSFNALGGYYFLGVQVAGVEV